MNNFYEEEKKNVMASNNPAENINNSSFSNASVIEDVNKTENIEIPENKISSNRYTTEGLKQRVENAQNEKKEQYDHYGIEMSQDQYDVLNKVIANAEDPEAQAYRFGTAIQYSKMYNIPLEEAMNRMDDYNAALWGSQTTKTPKEWYHAVADAGKMGVNTMELSSLGNQLREAERVHDDKKAAIILEQINKLNADNELLQDNIPRAWYVDALKFGAQSAPFTLYTAGAGILGSLFAPGVGTAAAWAASASQSAGLEYQELRQGGADPKAARTVSTLSGSLQGVVEVALGNVPALKALGKTGSTAVQKASGKVTEQLFKRLHYAGSFKTMAQTITKLSLDYGGEVLEEGAEEATQNIISELGKQLTKVLSDEYQLDDKTAGQIAMETAEAFRGGVLGSLVLSGIPLAANAKATYQDYANIRDSAITTQSKEAFRTETQEKIKNGETHVFDDMTEEQQKSVIDNIYDNYSNERKAAYEESVAETEDVKESKDLSEGVQEQETDEEGDRVGFSGEYRNEEGRLYVQNETKVTDKEGVTEGRVLVGDPSRPHANEESGNRYGYIDYIQKGDDVEITNFKMSPGRENLAEDFYTEFAEQFAGSNITWNPKYETNTALKQRIIAANPQGVKSGLNYYADVDSVAANRSKINLAKEFKQWLPNWKNEQVAAGVALAQAAANAKGISLDEYKKTYFQNGKMFTGIDTNAEQLQQQAGEDDIILGAAEFDKENRAIIYVTKYSDFNTFSHEMAHIFRRTLDEAQLAAAADAFKIADANNWTETEEETFADGFVDYLRTGKAPNNNLKELFEKAARFIADIIRGLQGTIDISDDIRSVYDSLLKDDGSGLSQAMKAAEKAERENAAKAKSETYMETAKDKDVSSKEAETTEESEEIETAENEKVKQTLEEITNKAVEDTNNSTTEKAEATVDEAGFNRQEAVEEEQQLDALFQLVGETSLLRMQENELKEIMHKNLNVAQEMAKKYTNEDAATIRNRIKIATNWEMNAAGIWQWETDDSLNQVKFASTFNKYAKEDPEKLIAETKKEKLMLSDVLDADELYSIYPELKNITVKFYKAEDGRYSKLDIDGIKINLAYVQDVNSELGLKASLGYEIQNYIQMQEIKDITKIISERKGIKYDIKNVAAALKEYRKQLGKNEAMMVVKRLKYNLDKRKHLSVADDMYNTANTKLLFQTVNKNNFYKETFANWKEVKNKPNRKPDYISNSGSKYWYDKEGVYRASTHWGMRVASSSWLLEGKEQQAADKVTEKIGYVKWNDFVDKNAESVYNSPIRMIYEMSEGDLTEKDLTEFKESLESVYDTAELKEKLMQVTLDDVKNYKKPEWEKLEYTGNVESTLFQKVSSNAELEEVRKQYENTDKWLKAPNGKKTNLTVQQWLEVRTPAFKGWYGDWENDPKNASKVLDENGEPKVMYHGTPNANFTEFNTGTYFTDDPLYAALYKETYASSISTKQNADNPDVYSVYLNIKKPFDTRKPEIKKIFDNEYYRKWGTGAPLAESGLPDWTDGLDLQEFIEENELDFDGLILDEGGVPDTTSATGVKKRGLSYVTFNATEVKSSTDNSGAFNTADPSILFQTVAKDNEYMAAVDADDEAKQQDLVDEAAEQAFPNSKVRDDYGNLLKVYHGRVSNFDVFDRQYGNIESDMGAGFYFTSQIDDVESNYASETGPDLKNKISMLAERYESEEDLDWEEAEKKARDYYITAEPNTVEAYLNMENPAVIDDNGEGTYLDYNENYDEDNDEYGEPEGTLVDFVEALQNNESNFETYGEIDYWGAMGDAIYEGGINLADAIRNLKENILEEVTDENGNLGINELIRQALEEIGYDGIIDHTVSDKFTNMEGMYGDTTHYIVFNSNQIKKADPVTYDNEGNIIPLSKRFNKESPSILFQKVYHGTPHNFEKFTTDAIGTGEGNQSFGWGLYFTNQEEIARDYAITLTGRPVNYKLNRLNISLDAKKDFLKQRKAAIKATENVEKYNAKIERNLKDFTKFLKEAQDANDEKDIEFYQGLIDHSKEQLTEEYRLDLIKSFNEDIEKANAEIADIKKQMKEVQKEKAEIEGNRNIYTVDIPDAKYLVWDKQYSTAEMKPIKDALYDRILNEYFGGDKESAKYEVESIFTDKTEGHQLYHSLQAELGSDKEASLFLNSLGYVGIDYPSNTVSGKTEEGKRNFVVFNDKDVAITNHILFQVIGKDGATNLDEYNNTTEKIDNLTTAQMMNADGKDAKTIKLATGWEKGADGNWKYEIDDSKYYFNWTDELKFEKKHPEMKAVDAYYLGLRKEPLTEEEKKLENESKIAFKKHQRLLFSGEALLSDYLQSEELYAAYPQLKDYELRLYRESDPEAPLLSGYYSPLEKSITLYRFENTDENKNSLLHEVQHAIQDIEGFAKGGNESFFDDYKYDLESEQQDLEAMRYNYELYLKDINYSDYVKQSMQEVTEKKKTLDQHWIDIENYKANSNIADILAKLEAQIAEQEDKISEIEENALDGQVHYNGTIYEDEFDAYKSLAGEVEARNVEVRSLLNADVRRQHLLSQSEDVDRDRQIILFQLAHDINTSTLELDDINRTKLLNLTVAKLMELRGEPAETIEKATAWKRNEKGLWQFNRDADYDNAVIEAYSNNAMSIKNKQIAAKNAIDLTNDVDEQDKKEVQQAQQVLFQDTYKTNRNILFQTEKEMMDEASTFNSWEEWQDYYETMWADDAEKAAPADADSEWYKTTWENAKKIQEQQPDIETLDEDSKDKEWYAMMQEEGKLDDFLRTIARTIWQSPWKPADEEEMRQLEKKDALIKRFDTEMRHGYWVEGAQRARATDTGDVGLSIKHRKALMTMMRNAKRDYRDLYADFTGEKEWAVAEGETTTEKLNKRLSKQYKIATPDLDFEAMTPAERKAFADQLDFEDLKKEVKDGTLAMDMSYIQGLMKGYDKEIKGLNKQIANLKKADTENAEMMVKQEAMLDKYKAELKGKMEARKQAEGVRDLKIRLIKNVNRKVDFKRIAYEEGKKIIAIQTLFQPLLRKFVNNFIDMEGPYIRDFYSKYKTDVEFKAKMRILAQGSHSRNAKKLLELLENVPYDKWTLEDRELAAKTAPKTNWIEQLRLDEIEKKRAGTLQLSLASEETQELLREALPPDLLALLTAKDLRTWTLEEMESLVAVVNDLFKDGRDTLNAKKEVAIERADKAREQIRKALRSSGVEISDDDTPAEKERKQKIIAKFNEKQLPKILGQYNAIKGTLAADAEKQGFFSKILHGYGDANIRRVARILDNGKDGINTTLLYYREDECFNREQRAEQKRTEKLNKVLADNNITLEALYEKKQVKFPDGTVQEFTVDELLFMEAAYADDTSRAAVACGNMYDEMFKKNYRGSTKLQLEYEELAMARLDACVAVAKTIPDNVRNLLYAIQDDYDQQYDEMNKVSIEEYNQPVWRVEHYVPLNRLETNGDENANRLKEDLLAASGSYAKTFGWVDRGMTQKRVEISPANQRPVQLGLYSTWVESMERTEHFIAYAGYLRDLNRIYKNRDAGAIRQMIENRYGKGMVSYIDQYINETANPKALNPKTHLDRIVRALRGKTAPAYLSWKMSSIIKQLCTSPWPFMQYISPWKYAASAIQFATDKNLREAIRAKSAYMNTRVYDPVVDLINEQKEKVTNKVKHAFTEFEAMGMKGLEMVDWCCVAPGWLAVYKDEYARISDPKYQDKLVADARKKYEQYSDVNGWDWVDAQAEAARMTESDIEELAVRKADDVTRMCQPSSRITDLSPIFKEGNEISKAFLQFTTSLNVIWQNIRYDLPQAVKAKEWQRVIGTIAGYTLAGLAVGLVSEGLDDDDEEEKKAGQIAFYAMSQFTDAIPVVGSIVSNTTESALTNEWKFTSSNNLFPISTKAVNTIRAVSKEDWDKAAQNFSEAAGIAIGLPVSGTKEILTVAGVGHDEGFYPQAIVGRRPE